MMRTNPVSRFLQRTVRLFTDLLKMAWEMVIWGNVRAGSISLQDSPPSFRLLARLGLWLILALLLLLPLSQLWRAVSPLQPLIFFTYGLAGSFAPVYFTPLVLGLLALAWAYWLAGTLHAHWAARLGGLFLFGLFEASFALNLLPNLVYEWGLIGSGAGFSLWSTLALLAQFGGWLLLVVVFLWRGGRPARLALEFPLLLAVCAGLLFSSYFSAQWGSADAQSGAVAGGLLLTQALGLISTFLLPYLLICGSEIAALGMSITEAAAGVLRSIRPGRGQALWAAALAGFLVLRLVFQWVIPLFTLHKTPGWGAALIVLLLLVITAWGRWGRARAPQPASALPAWVIPSTALGLYAAIFVLQITTFFLAAASLFLLAFDQQAGALLQGFNQVWSQISALNELLVSALALLAAGLLWLRSLWRQQALPPAALFLVVFGVWLSWWAMTRSHRLLGALTFQYEDFSAWMTPVLLGLLLVSAMRRRMQAQQLLHLSAAALLLWLLEWRDLLSDPLSPLFGPLFAQAGAQAALVSVGIFLNVMSAGSRFSLNAGTPGFPRQARSLVYLGYALLTVIQITWLAATHQSIELAFNDQISQNGYYAIGLPLAFWALIAGSRAVLGKAGE